MDKRTEERKENIRIRFYKFKVLNIDFTKFCRIKHQSSQRLHVDQTIQTAAEHRKSNPDVDVQKDLVPFM